MKIKPDLSESIEAVPPGTYAALVKGVEVKDAKTGSKYLRWELEVTDHEKFTGRKLWNNTMISGPGAFKLQELYLAATGQPLPKDNPEFDTEQVIGQKVGVAVADGKDQQGQPTGFPEVKRVVRLQTGTAVNA